MAPLRFYWLRHAPPINPLGICYGQDDIEIDLTDITALCKQAERLPLRAAWVSSSSPRAMDTAAALCQLHADARRAVICPDPGLLEQSFGEWAGQKVSDLKKDPSFAAYLEDPENIAPPNGENLARFASRIGNSIENIIRAHPQGGNIVVVAHGGTIRAAIHHATGLPMDSTLRLHVDPLSLTVLRHDINMPHAKRLPWTVEQINSRPR